MEKEYGIYPLAFSQVDSVITVNAINICLLKKDKLSDFKESELIPAVSIDSIEKVILDENQLSVKIYYYYRTMENVIYYFSNRDHLVSFMQELSGLPAFKPKKTREISAGIPWRYAILFVLPIVATIFLYNFALMVIDPNNDFDVNGKKQLLKAILLFIVGLLGPWGVLFIGVLWVGFAGNKLYSVMKNRTNKTEYHK